MRERRRGTNLEDAILDAAWAELDERGYTALTMDGVAARAGTSRPVLARRWDGRAALAIAAIRRRMALHPLDVQDHGDVRAELVALLDRAAERAATLVATFALFAAEYSREVGATPAALRLTLLSGEADSLTPIFERAVARGELDADKLKPPVASLLPDLFRHHAIMTWTAPDPALRAAWIDTIFLPLVLRRAD